MDTSSGHNQEMSSDSVGNMLVVGPKASAGGGTQQQASNPQERKPRPHPEQAQKCPRCDSANTKFCYYNNYSLTQPRYFCKACRRYWTKGGTLRNVPVGGGCRKNRRSSSSSSSSSSSAALASKSRVGPQEHLHNPLIHPALLGPTGGGSHGFPLPSLLGGGAGCYDQNDLTLAFARLQKSGAEQLGFDGLSILGSNINASSGHNDLLGLNSASSGAFLEALRSGFLESSASQNSSAAGNSVTSGFQNLYYGFCNNGNSNNIGDVSENSTPTTTVGVSGVSDHHHHMGMANYDHDDDHDHVSNATTTAVTVTTIKQELSHGNGMRGGYNDHDQHDHQNSRMLWGIPNWQLSGSDHHGIGSGNLSEFDGSASTGRESWNGFASSWHGLLNTTPLM